MNLKYLLYTLSAIIAVIIFVVFVNRNIEFSSNLVEINKTSEVNNLVVKKAYNERGSYILNDSAFVGLAFIADSDSNKIQIDDNAIWRPKGSKHIPSISDINPPFEIHKNGNSDSLFLTKNGNTLIFILSE